MRGFTSGERDAAALYDRLADADTDTDTDTDTGERQQIFRDLAAIDFMPAGN